MYAIIETGGKQYRAAVGELLKVELLGVENDQEVTLDRVLMVADDAGGFRVGNPYVDGASVKAEVKGEGKGKKVLGFKHRRRKNYRRKLGHRQHYTEIRVTAIVG